MKTKVAAIVALMMLVFCAVTVGAAGIREPDTVSISAFYEAEDGKLTLLASDKGYDLGNGVVISNEESLCFISPSSPVYQKLVEEKGVELTAAGISTDFDSLSSRIRYLDTNDNTIEYKPTQISQEGVGFFESPNQGKDPQLRATLPDTSEMLIAAVSAQEKESCIISTLDKDNETFQVIGNIEGCHALLDLDGNMVGYIYGTKEGLPAAISSAKIIKTLQAAGYSVKPVEPTGAPVSPEPEVTEETVTEAPKETPEATETVEESKDKTVTKAPEELKKSGSVLPVIIVIVLFLLLIGGIVAFVLLGKSPDKVKEINKVNKEAPKKEKKEPKKESIKEDTGEPETDILSQESETDVLDTPQASIPEAYLIRKKTGEKIVITKTPFIIGRSVNDTDYIVKDNSTVGRQHFRIDFADGAFTGKDLNSRNGTLLNGQHLTERAATLSTQDTIVLSDEVFTFYTEAGDDIEDPFEF